MTTLLTCLGIKKGCSKFFWYKEVCYICALCNSFISLAG